MNRDFQRGCVRLAAMVALVLSAAVHAAYNVKQPEIRPAWSGAELGVWTQDYASATNAAAQTGKPVIVVTSGMWWCPYCQPLEAKVFVQKAWTDFIDEIGGAYLVVLDFPYRGTVSAAESHKTADFDARTGRPGWGFTCWLYDEEYRNENGISADDAFRLIEERNYAWQNALGLPSAQTVTIANWDDTDTFTYRRVGYPTLIVMDSNGRILGRPPSNVRDTATKTWTVEEACDYVIGNVRTVLRADAGDEADNLAVTAPFLDDPACAGELFTQGEHTLSSIDTADWYRIEIPESYGETWHFAVSPRDGFESADLVLAVGADEAGKTTLVSANAAASEGSVSVVFPSAGIYHVKVSPKDALSSVAGYVFRYGYDEVVVPASFERTSASFANNASDATLTVKLGSSGTNHVTEVDWRTVDGTASNGVDFVTTGGTLRWEAGEARGAKTISIPILAPESASWQSRGFTVELYPKSHCSIPASMASCTVTLTTSSTRNPGTIAFDGFWTTAKPVYHEGEVFSADVLRTGGYEGAVSATVTLSMSGASYRETFEWGHNDREAKKLVWTLPTTVGMQDDKAGSFELTASGGAALGSPNKAQFVLRDSLAVESFDEYNASTLGGIASVQGNAWFYGRESEDATESVLRSRTLTAAGTTLSLALTGPAILSLSVVPKGGATATLRLGDKMLSNAFSGKHLVAIPAGLQTVAIVGARGTEADSYLVADWTVTSLSQFKLIASSPVDGSWVRATDDFVLSAKLAEARALPDEATLEVITYAGNSSSALKALPCGGAVALTADGSSYPAKGDVVAQAAFADFATNAVGAYAWWRMDVSFTDEYGNMAERQGRTAVMRLVPEDVPDVASADALPEGWSVSDASVLCAPDMMVGSDASAIGVLPAVNVGEGDSVAVEVKEGNLPDGLTVAAGKGGIVFNGSPVRAGEAEAMLQLVVTKASGEIVRGATFGVAFATTELGDLAGEYAGYRIVRTAEGIVQGAGFGEASLTVGPTGRLVGRFVWNGERYSFVTSSFGEWHNGTIVFSGVAAASSALERAIDVRIFENSEEHDAVIAVGEAEYWLYRNNWRTSAGRSRLKEIVGTYTAALPVAASDPAGFGPRGTGYLHAQVKDNGIVSYFGIDSLGRYFVGASPAYYVFDCCTGSGKRWFFYVNTVPNGITNRVSGLSGLVAVTPDEKDASVRYLSTDSVPLSLVNLETDAVYPRCWTNSINVVGGTFDIPSGMDVELAREMFAANEWEGAIGSYARNTGEFTAQIVRKEDASSATVKGVHVMHAPGGRSFWSGLYVQPDKTTETKIWE